MEEWMADNVLYYGDNLDVLRHNLKDESVDLVYLDPPFNSNATYNVLFAAQDGTRSAAQIKAFEDTWQWDQAAAYDYQKTVEAGGPVAQAMLAFHTLLGPSNMLAYLAMMAPRLLELHRVLKPTGSLYLHCDPNASHYLKLLLDAVFGPERFRNEIIWKRTSGRKGVSQYGRVHDVILFYTKTSSAAWTRPKTPQTATTARGHDLLREPNGAAYRLSDLTGAGVRHGETGKPWRGFEVTSRGRHWAYLHSELDRLDEERRIHWPRAGGFPRLKVPLESLPGVAIHGSVKVAIRPIRPRPTSGASATWRR
jgi:DNA modification methylase